MKNIAKRAGERKRDVSDNQRPNADGGRRSGNPPTPRAIKKRAQKKRRRNFLLEKTSREQDLRPAFSSVIRPPHRYRGQECKLPQSGHGVEYRHAISEAFALGQMLFVEFSGSYPLYRHYSIYDLVIYHFVIYLAIQSFSFYASRA